MVSESYHLYATIAVIVWSLLSTVCISEAAASKNGSDMVRIAAGMFLMGSNSGPEDERPQHHILVGEFLIDRTPVTNAQFAQFIDAKGTQSPDGQRWYDTDDNDARIHLRAGKWLADSGAEHHPVVEASWYGAQAYCAWLGKRLPTEPSGKRLRGEPTGGNILGETSLRTGVVLISVRVGMTCDRWEAYQKAPVPTESWT